jgi:hypothetical protein
MPHQSIQSRSAGANPIDEDQVSDDRGTDQFTRIVLISTLVRTFVFFPNGVDQVLLSFLFGEWATVSVDG